MLNNKKIDLKAEIIRLYDHNVFFHAVAPTLEDIRIYYQLTNQEILDIFNDPIFFAKIKELHDTLKADQVRK